MANLYVADVASYNLDDINGLRVDGVRAARARYPNVQSIETNLFPEGWITESTATWSKPLLAPAPEVNIEVASNLMHCLFVSSPRICARTLLGCSIRAFSRGGSLLPSSYADARYIDDVIAF